MVIIALRTFQNGKKWEILTKKTAMKIAKLKIGKTVKSGISYFTIFVPAYLTPEGKAKRMYFRTKAEAEVKRAELVAATRTESRETVLSNAQLVDARRALERLAEAGLNMGLDRAVELALPLLRASGRHISVECLLADFAQAKAPSWRGKTATNFRTVARMFNERFGTLMVTEVSGRLLNGWLESFGRPAYAVGLVRTLRPAFSWAVRQGMLSVNPFSRIEPIRVPARKAIDVFSPEEARRLMEVAPPDCRAAFALLLFAGIRPVELTRLRWGAVRDGFIHLTPDVTKTAQVRNVEVEPNLAAWLAAAGPHAPEEPVCPPWWNHKNRMTRREAGLVNRQDTARHSYATYHLAKYHDRVALEENMGHSAGSAMLMRHYRAAATPAQAEEYWGIMP